MTLLEIENLTIKLRKHGVEATLVQLVDLAAMDRVVQVVKLV